MQQIYEHVIVNIDVDKCVLRKCFVIKRIKYMQNMEM